MRWRGPRYLSRYLNSAGAPVSALVASLRKELGQRLGQLVKASGKSQRELAEVLGVHQTVLSGCIRGERFSVERIALLLEKLGHIVEFKGVVCK